MVTCSLASYLPSSMILGIGGGVFIFALLELGPPFEFWLSGEMGLLAGLGSLLYYWLLSHCLGVFACCAG